MSDFRKQVRDHYDAQSLPPEKVEAILAQGRGAAAGEADEKTIAFPKRAGWRRSITAIAAVVALSLGGMWWMNRDAGHVSYTAMAPRVVEFFAKEPHLLPPVQDKKELHEWLVAQGAPKDFEIPAKLMGLESAACSVVDVKSEKAYLSCYWREKNAQPDPHDLIHLLVARTDSFYDQPKSAQATTQELDGWSFASWTKGDTIYMLATAAPMEKMTPFLSLIERANGGIRFSSGMGGQQAAMGLATILRSGYGAGK